MSEIIYIPDEPTEDAEWIERPGFEGRLTSRSILKNPVVLDRLVGKYEAFKYLPDDKIRGKGRLMVLAASNDSEKEI